MAEELLNRQRSTDAERKVHQRVIDTVATGSVCPKRRNKSVDSYFSIAQAGSARRSRLIGFDTSDA
jgi:hypothetical protein